MQPSVGMLGLGIMGSAISANPLKAGFRVVGCDVSRACMQALSQIGGETAACPRDVAWRATLISR